MQAGIVGLLFFDPDRQTTPVGAAGALAASLLPYTVVGPFAGAALDRWRRQPTLLVVNVLRAVLSGGVAALTLQGSLFWLAVCVLLGLSLNRFFLAGQTAGLPHVVPPGHLVAANATTPTLGTAAAVAGGWATATLLALTGTGPAHSAVAILCAAACYLCSAALTVPLGPRGLGPESARSPSTTMQRAGRPVGAGARADVRSLLAGLVAGVRHLRAHDEAKAALITIAAVRMAVGLLMIATLVLARNHLADSAERGLALLASTAAAAGVGAGLGAILTPAATRRIGRGKWSVACLLSAAIATLTLVPGVGPNRIIFVCGVTAFAAMAVKIGVDSLLHATVADEYRGRVFSVYDAIFNAALILAAAIGAATVPDHGNSWSLFVAISLLMLLAAVPARDIAARRPNRAAGPRPTGTSRHGR